MKMNSVIDKLSELLKPIIEETGFRAVRFKIFRNGKVTILQIMIEHKDAYLNLIQGDGGVNANDCAKVSYAISPVLDGLDYLPINYNLEVSSPGIDRPLVTEKDFERFIGFEINVEFKKKYLGKKYLRGKLIIIKDNNFSIRVSEEIFEIDRNIIRAAKLVLTSELIEYSKSANEKFKENKESEIL